MNLKKLLTVPLGLLLCLSLASCQGQTTNEELPAGFQGPPAAPQPTILAVNPEFDPASTTKEFPIFLPFDLARNTTTGQNQITGTGEPFDAFNSLFGFSTAGPLLIPFNGTVDPNTVNNRNIILVDTVSGQQRPLTFTMEIGDAGAGSLVRALPVTPLIPSRRHLIIVTNRVLGTNGLPVASNFATGKLKETTSLLVGTTSNSPLLTDAQAAALEPIRIAYNTPGPTGLTIWQAAEGITGQPRSDIPFVAFFTTQPLFVTMQTIRGRIQAENPTFGLNLNPGGQFVGAPAVINAFIDGLLAQGLITQATRDALVNGNPGAGIPPIGAAVGAIRFGSFTVTNYMPNINSATQGFFQGTLDNPTPLGTFNEPFMVMIPRAGFPNPGLPGGAVGPGPYPVVVFQHGVTRSKEDMLAIYTLCAQGVAVIGCDAVLHGQNQAPGVPTTAFFNVANLRVFRDNVRMTSIFGLTLVRLITSGNTNFDGVGGPDLAPNPPLRPVYLGQSLGGIIGGITMAVEPNLSAGVLNVAGGRWTTLLLDSASFGAPVLAGLAAQGLPQGSPDFTKFIWVAQTVVDDADPFNYAPSILTGALRGGNPAAVMVQEMLDDQAVPNSATTDLTMALNRDAAFSQVNAKRVKTVTPPGLAAITLPQVAAPFVGSGLFQEQGGSHGYLLDPTAGGPGGALTAHGQLQAFSFLLPTFQGAASGPIIPKEALKGIVEWTTGVDQTFEWGD